MRIRLKTFLALSLAALVASGCSTEYYKQSADDEVYKILEEKHAELFDTQARYEIEQIASDPMGNLVRAEEALLEMPEGIERDEELPLIVSHTQALTIATYNNREYQRRKEEVYLTALSLTDARHEFSAQFDGFITSYWKKAGNGTETFSASGGFGLVRMLKTGAMIGIDISTEFLRYLTGDPRRTVASILAVEIIQPLWRGAGRRIATENLTQSERNVVYAIREFARYKKTFSVDITTDYFRILQQRDVVRNELNNYNNLKIIRDRSEMLAKAGRLQEFEVDQARQNELRARDRWVSAVQSYFSLLDNFKLKLGIPVDTNVDLNDADLEALVAKGINHPDLPLATAVERALVGRLDLQNTLEKVEDAQRKVVVAANNLAPQIDLVFSMDASTTSPSMGGFRFNRATWNAGLDIDLPLDRLSERNDYRESLINLVRAQRNFAEDADDVKLAVRSAWRTLQEKRESYKIQSNSLELALRRVDSITMLLQAGRADMRDMLDAQESLIDAQNALVGALTDHAIARLQFYRDIGSLQVDDLGLIHEPENENEPKDEDSDESQEN